MIGRHSVNYCTGKLDKNRLASELLVSNVYRVHFYMVSYVDSSSIIRYKEAKCVRCRRGRKGNELDDWQAKYRYTRTIRRQMSMIMACKYSINWKTFQIKLMQLSVTYTTADEAKYYRRTEIKWNRQALKDLRKWVWKSLICTMFRKK